MSEDVVHYFFPCVRRRRSSLFSFLRSHDRKKTRKENKKAMLSLSATSSRAVSFVAAPARAVTCSARLPAAAPVKSR
jgi:hypothetical protein